MPSLASVIIVTYNHKKHISNCINSVLKQDYPHEIIIVDNCSDDGTAESVEKNFPEVKIVKSKKNLGYGAGNNLGVRNANGEYVAILNPDTITERSWLKNLVKPLENNEQLITTSKILNYDGSMINACGLINHFTGLPFPRGFGEKPNTYNVPEFVDGISGCSFCIKKNYYEELGGFDENFFVYNEDSDFSWKAHLNKFRILYVPTSVVKHDYTLKLSPQKIYYLEKHRYMILRKHFSKKEFLHLLPSLIIADLLTFGYAINYGLEGINFKLKAIKDGINININKEKGDKDELFKSLSKTIPDHQLMSNRVEKIIRAFANKIFEWNYKAVMK